MQDKIINRVAKSNLQVINLEDYYPEGKRIVLDIKSWLFEGFILREKEFREALKNHDWSQYQNAHVALTCGTDAIIPAWAYMLIETYLQPFVKKSIIGSLDQLETSIYQDIIASLDVSKFHNKPVIIKGCASKPIPQNAYIMLVNKLKPVVKSMMYGEACSSVPLYKHK